MTLDNKYIHNVATGEIIIEPLNETDLKDLAKAEKFNSEKAKLKEAEAEAKATQRQAILDRLGLTSEEAALLLP